MPKPLEGENGSGLHINMSLMKDGQNIFYDRNDPKGNGLSQEAYYFISGIMEHIKAMTAINNPTVNSYKRLIKGYEAPVYICWSCKNRSPLIRVPASRGCATRVELRSPDPTANPYLVLAACLKAGLDGIKKCSEPPEQVSSNIFKMKKSERRKLGIDNLPDNLEKALKELKKDEVIKEAIGQHVLKCFLKLKKKELKEFRNNIAAWELNKYLNY